MGWKDEVSDDADEPKADGGSTTDDDGGASGWGGTSTSDGGDGDESAGGWGGSPVDESDDTDEPASDDDGNSRAEDIEKQQTLNDDGDELDIDETGDLPDAEGAPEPENATAPDDDDGDDVAPADADDDGGDGGEETDEMTPSVTSAVDMTDTPDDESNGADDGVSGETADGAPEPPTPSSAISVEQAAERDRRWKIMAWGPPKLFKTHMGFTMPEPVAFLDLEGKADDIAHKFTNREVQIWQPKSMTAEPDTKFRRTRKALDEALEWLDWHREKRGVTGSIVVDSMSLMWEWAQTHHILENYKLKDPEEVELSANFNSSQESDWQVIKEYHNGEFRGRIVDSPYHFYWTAMERVDFEETFEDEQDRQYYEPKGEKNNPYKADTILRARKDDDSGKVGDLVGSNFTDNVFVGMEKPTFPKVRDAVNRIEEAESSDEPVAVDELADAIEAETIIDHDPQVYVQE
ncbi:hypothetical protein Z052_01940 [Halorubrum sp. C191]|uniref:AAA family ATPase n=1 Tax=Halorubrum sp. C191 TaxID=1383842 RepID=UPI000C06FA3F|nr:AAA family ATPase [Halorubrum sp. C191]PHQ43924.1 hypothetical protein Z052_01940 [Halorubrum sp. C191]